MYAVQNLCVDIGNECVQYIGNDRGMWAEVEGKSRDSKVLINESLTIYAGK